MISFDDVTKENSKKHNQSWPQILDHSHRIWILGNSVSAKSNSSFNLISH